MTIDHQTFDERFESAEDTPSNPQLAHVPTIGDVIAARFDRRDVLKGALGVTAIAATMGSVALGGAKTAEAATVRGFKEIEHGVDTTHHVAEGYDAEILIRWGDAVLPNAPAFDPMNQSAAAQEMQFGYNNDYVGYIPLPVGSKNPDHALLCVNHEYTSVEVMLPGVGDQEKAGFDKMTKEFVDIEMAAHGGSVIEIKRTGGKWAVVNDSGLNRRITANTPMVLTGPAAGHDRMKTNADPTGTRVLGTINNCAGGVTPWGTYLMAEENFNGYFWGKAAAEASADAAKLKRYGIPGEWYNWGQHHARFDVSKEPNEVNRFGWVVEVDVLDPTSTPKKRTALGRFKHEGAETIINKDGRIVVYMGDDERFDYVYKFVSAGRFDPNNRAANMDLLDAGTLFVAKYNEDGTVDWMPLVFGTAGLTPANGFNSQADVMIDTRLAADVLGATPMDRPEDVDPNPVTNKVYVMLTNNSRRKAEQVDKANARADNIWGQIVEMTPPDGDHGALKYTWDVLVQCGDPSVAEVGATFNPATSKNGWFACPDNCAVDNAGNLWITTDQGGGWKKASGTADGVWALETEGKARGTGKMFFRVPVGAEMCGPKFSPDDKTLFVAVQHPATDGTKDFPGFERASTFEDPATRWPDFKDGMPPRPSVVTITKKDGGVIGS